MPTKCVRVLFPTPGKSALLIKLPLTTRLSGSKWPKPAKYRITSSDFTNFLQLTFRQFYCISVSGLCVRFTFKICQIIAGISIICQFHDFFKSHFWRVFAIWPNCARLVRTSDLFAMYETGNTSSLPFWRTSTLRRLHRPPRPIISCIPAPCPEPPVWSLEAIMRHRPSEATRTGYGLARRQGRRPYQPRPLGGAPLSVDSIDDPFSNLQSGRDAEKAHRNADERQLLLLR
jgi:hypothetical protein